MQEARFGFWFWCLVKEGQSGLGLELGFGLGIGLGALSSSGGIITPSSLAFNLASSFTSFSTVSRYLRSSDS